ncbi:MAG: hypothetical protein IIA60_07545 [Candidatus Marinimicrobia bacterium]|nr:hypothetical protein [Candidatus Neomarinimicrobiota bacterium]
MAPPLTHFLKTIRLGLPLLLVTLPGLSTGQTGTPATTGNITEIKRLVILPAIDETDDTGFSINREVNRAVASVAARLGRFHIIDRNDLEAILQEQDLALLGLVDDSSAVEIGRIAAAQEALRITVLNFHQIGVPKDSDKDEDDDDDEESAGTAIATGIFGALLKAAAKEGKEELDPYRDNIQTQISIEVRNIDVETGQTLYSFQAGASHTGGARGKSREKAMRKLRNSISTELRKFYLLESRVMAVRGDELFLPLGSAIGLRRGMLFTIVEPDRQEQFGDMTIAIPGRPVAYARVQEVSETGNRSLVLRRWGEIRPGYAAREQIAPLWGLLLDARPGVSGSFGDNLGLGLRIHGAAISGFDFGLGLHYASAIDSRDHSNPGFQINAMAGRRMRLSRAMALFTRVELGFGAYFRDDDNGQMVNAGVGILSLGADLELLRSQGSDLVVGLAWRFGGKSSKWTYSEGDGDDSKTVDAEWDLRGAPDVDISGLFVTVGYRFIFPGVRRPGLPIPGL